MHDRTQGEWDCAAYRRACARDDARGSGCSNDSPEEFSAGTVKVVIARKARPSHPYSSTSEVRVGDQVRVTSGFNYIENGPRTGYFRRYSRMVKGPGWASEVN